MSGYEWALRVTDLGYRWPASTVDVLDRISFAIARGERVALLGRSGIGKTTLAKIIAGLVRPTRGRAELRAPAVSNGASAVDIAFQNNTLLPWLTVMDNVTFGVAATGPAGRDAALDILREVGLPNAARLYPRDLSGGMRQRVSVARAILRRCQLTILDEPFSALDLLTRESLYALIERISASYSIAYLIVTHLPEDAYRACTRCLVLNRAGAGIDEIIIADHATFEAFRSDVMRSLAR